jgi:hypothetical protein
MVRIAGPYLIRAIFVIVTGAGIVTGLTRRTWLVGAALAVVAAPLARMGWVWRRRHPRDLAPIPWIGHC